MFLARNKDQRGGDDVANGGSRQVMIMVFARFA